MRFVASTTTIRCRACLDRLAVLLSLFSCSDVQPIGVPMVNPQPVIGPALKVLTYNVNFELFSPTTVDAVRATNADLVVLQESNAQWERAFRDVGYAYTEFRAHDPDGGMAVLSRMPFQTVEWRASPVGKFPAWCLRAETALGTLDVLAVHLHPPLDENGLLTGYFTTSDERVAEVRHHMACFGRDTDLAVGDFNEGEGEALDVVKAAGLRDAAEAFPPVARTWEMLVGSTVLQGRPDHVFLGQAWVPVRIEVLEAGGSDHRPLLVTLQPANWP